MLRIVQNSSASGAKCYYSRSDYYSQGQELAGTWHGKTAAMLGLAGEIAKADWDALCDNRDPLTGRTLTPRQKEPRRIGYDFNFHCPKSVSLLYGLTGDERIVEAFRAAVGQTMQDIEAEAKTRIRRGGKNDDRTTGNLVWGEYVHTTARPVDGVPDPHLHAHCFVFNCTWDQAESRFKAAQFAGLKRDAPYFEALFHSRLAHGMEGLGLATERTKRGWELRDVPKSALPTFSRRTTLIEALAKAKGIADPELKGQLGAKTRESKKKDLTLDALRREWHARLTASESDAVIQLTQAIGQRAVPQKRELIAGAVDRAIDHCFERSSVMPERRVLTHALRQSAGLALPETVAAELGGRDLLTAERQGERLATTKAVLAEERRMIAFAREGRGTCPRLGTGPHVFSRDWLNEGQRRAVQQILDSHDRVMLIRGAAGAGKTAMALEAAEAIVACGKRVFAFAPSAEASRGVLRQEGFADADTVARLLVDESLQRDIEGQVIWIDEASLLGSKAMGQVFDLANRLDARVILCGDRRQHGSVERGAALRLLEEEAGVRPAELREIQRQKGAYKDAVRAFSEGDVEQGFKQLDKLGWVKERPGDERYAAMADDYLAAIKAGKSVLCVCPTHREGAVATAAIRGRLKEAGLIGRNERTVVTLESAKLTESQRRDAVNFEQGDVLVFSQNAQGHQKGERLQVNGTPLPLDQAARFDLFRVGSLPLAKGDLIRVTRNGMTADGKHRLNNGSVYAVKGFSRHGDIILAKGWQIARDFGHLASGFVNTSHASQGKTVDRAFVMQSAESIGASSREQAYVSLSRARESTHWYTDDKDALLDAVRRSNNRLSATELVAQQQAQARAIVATRSALRSPAAPSVAMRHEDRDHER